MMIKNLLPFLALLFLTPNLCWPQEDLTKRLLDDICHVQDRLYHHASIIYGNDFKSILRDKFKFNYIIDECGAFKKRNFKKVTNETWRCYEQLSKEIWGNEAGRFPEEKYKDNDIEAIFITINRLRYLVNPNINNCLYTSCSKKIEWPKIFGQ
jgi:hypothetical protein